MNATSDVMRDEYNFDLEGAGVVLWFFLLGCAKSGKGGVLVGFGGETVPEDIWHGPKRHSYNYSILPLGE